VLFARHWLNHQAGIAAAIRRLAYLNHARPYRRVECEFTKPARAPTVAIWRVAMRHISRVPFKAKHRLWEAWMETWKVWWPRPRSRQPGARRMGHRLQDHRAHGCDL